MAEEKKIQVVVDESAAVKGIEALNKSMSGIQTTLSILNGSIGSMNGVLAQLASASGSQASGGMEKLAKNLGSVFKESTEVAGAFTKASGSTVNIAASLAQMTSTSVNAGAGLAQLVSKSSGVIGSLAGATANGSAMSGAMANLSASVGGASSGIASFLGPLGAAFTGLSAVVGIASQAVDWFGKMEEKYRGENEILTATKQQLAESASGMETLVASRQQNVDAGMGEIAMTEMLYGKLEGMADANGVIAAKDVERAQILAEKLNPTLGETMKLNEDGSAALVKSADDVKTYLEQKKAQMLIEAMEPEVKYALVESSKLYSQMMQNSAQIEQNNQQIKANTIAYDKALAEGDYETAEQLAKSNAQKLKDNEALQESNDEMLGAYEGYTKTIADYDANMTASMEGDTESIVNGQAAQKYAAEDTNEKVSELYAQRVVDAEGSLSTLKEIHKNDTVDLGDAIYSNAEGRLDTVKEEYSALGQSAADGLNEGIDEGEPGVAENAAGMVNGANAAADAQTGQFNQTGAESADDYKQGVSDQTPQAAEIARQLAEETARKADEAKGLYAEAGTNSVSGFKGSLIAQRDELTQYVHDYFQGIGNSGKKALQINSPSKVFQKIGDAVGEGFRLGMEQDKPAALKTVQDYFHRMVDAVNFENRKLSVGMTSGTWNNLFGQKNGVINENSVAQTINFNQPVQTPAQMSRALRRESQKLARGVI